MFPWIRKSWGLRCSDELQISNRVTCPYSIPGWVRIDHTTTAIHYYRKSKTNHLHKNNIYYSFFVSLKIRSWIYVLGSCSIITKINIVCYKYIMLKIIIQNRIICCSSICIIRNFTWCPIHTRLYNIMYVIRDHYDCYAIKIVLSQSSIRLQ